MSVLENVHQAIMKKARIALIVILYVKIAVFKQIIVHLVMT
jgi:hypothetical protein